MSLSDLRQHIDQLDRELLATIHRRFEICLQTRQHKTQVEDIDRETQLRALWQEHVGELGLSQEFADQLLTLLLAEAKRLQAHHADNS